MDTNKYSVKIGIELEDGAVANIKKEIESQLSNEKINIKIDTSGLSDVSTKANNASKNLDKITKSDKLSKTGDNAKKAAKGVNDLNQNLEKTTKHIKNQSFATDNWAYNWSKAMQSFLTYNTVTQFFNTVSNGIKDMIGQVKELDDALTEFKKVSDLSGESLEKYVNQAYEMGRAVAKTGTEMIEAATSFKKSGYTDEMSLQLAEVATMYTNIADEAISSADAADMIIAQLKAFKLETEDTTETLENAYHIIDAINEVANNFAVSSSDIASNLGKASAVMANAGNSLEQMIGLMTAGTEITRNASKVANGLKTITLRLQGMNDEGEKNLELQAQMEGLFNKLGISVYDANGELKNTYDILATLAPVYKELSNAEKAYVTETIAGKYQAQNAAAILQNWETAINATTTALDSNGSATKENQAVLDSIQGHLQQLNSAWEQLSKNIFNSDLLKFIIDLGTHFLNFANSGLGQTIIKMTLLSTVIMVVRRSYSSLLTAIKKSAAALVIEKAATEKETAALIKNKIASLSLGDAIKILAARKILASKGSKAITSAQVMETASTLTLSSAFKALTASMLANPMFWGAAAVVGISALVGRLNDLGNSAQKAYEKAKEESEKATEEYEKAKSEVENLNSELEGTKSRIEELQSKGKLSFTEEQELKNLKETTAELEKQVAYAKILETQKQKEANKKKVDEIEKDLFANDVTRYRNNNNAVANTVAGWGVPIISDVAAGMTTESYKISEIDVIDEVTESYEDAINKFNEYSKKVIDIKGKIADATKEGEDTSKLEEELSSAEYWEDFYRDYSADKKNELADYAKRLKEYSDALVYVEDATDEADIRSNQFKEALGKQYKQILKLIEPEKALGIEISYISTQYSGAYKKMVDMAKAGDLNETSLENLLESYPELETYLQNLNKDYGWTTVDIINAVSNALKNTNDKAAETSTIYSTLSEKMKGLQSNYDILTAAVDEFNKEGYISASTFKSLVDKNLLNYLEWTANGLQANTQELLNEADALKINALASLQESYAKDVLAIANNDLSAGTSYLTQALKDEKGAINGLGDLAKAQTGGLFDLAKAQAAVQATGGKLDVDKYGEKLTKLNNYYNNLAQSIANVNIGANPSSKYKGSGSGSGSSKSEKEWWEKELEALKDQFDNNEITVNEYINSLTNLLGKVGQGTEAWKKINKELQKQKLDKIKDNYDAGRISLNQYIISLQNLQKEYKQSTKEWNSLADAIKKAKLDQLKEQQNDLKEALSAVNNTLEKQIDLQEELKDKAIDNIEKQIDAQEKLKENYEKDDDRYQRAQKAVVDFLNEQLDSINEQKDTVENYYDDVINAIEKMNEDTKESIELAEAYEALMNAMTQKTKKVYKEGLGWVWTTDAEAIKEAKKTYEDLITSATTKEIEEQKDKTVKSLEEQIESLQDYIDSWDKVFDKFDNEKNRNFADILLGENWSEMVSNLDPQIVDDFSDAYYELQKNLEETEKQIEELNKQKEEEDEQWNKLIKDLQDYKGEWADIASVYEEEQNTLKAKQIMGANWEKEILDRRLDVLENFKNKYNTILKEIDKVDNMSADQASGYTALRLPGYANGGEVDYTGLAVLHGTPNKPEYVLNNSQMRNLLGNLTKPRTTSIINNKSGAVVNNYNFGDIELPNVTNAQQFANELKSMLNITKNQ